MSPERLPGMPLKRLTDTIDYVFTKLHMKLLFGSSGYKNTSQGRELRRIQTYMPHTMGSKSHDQDGWRPRCIEG
jgi:hypothetical protein